MVNQSDHYHHVVVVMRVANLIQGGPSCYHHFPRDLFQVISFNGNQRTVVFENIMAVEDVR